MPHSKMGLSPMGSCVFCRRIWSSCLRRWATTRRSRRRRERLSNQQQPLFHLPRLSQMIWQKLARARARKRLMLSIKSHLSTDQAQFRTELSSSNPPPMKTALPFSLCPTTTSLQITPESSRISSKTQLIKPYIIRFSPRNTMMISPMTCACTLRKLGSMSTLLELAYLNVHDVLWPSGWWSGDGGQIHCTVRFPSLIQLRLSVVNKAAVVKLPYKMTLQRDS